MKKIKTITAYTSFVGEDNKREHEYKSFYEEFDLNQNVIKNIVYSDAGEVETASGYRFDESNRLIKVMHYLNESEISQELNYKYSYGELSQIETIYSDGSITIKTIRKNGRVVTTTIRGDDKIFEGEELRRHDGYGNVVEEFFYDENKLIRQRFLYEYDNKSKLICSTEFGADETFVVKKTFEYDHNGNILKESHYSEWGNLMSYILSEYNIHGKLISQQYDMNQLLKLEYDDDGRIIKEETAKIPNGMVISSKRYHYDKNNNLKGEISFDLGEQYDLQPGVSIRTGLNYVNKRFHYEFY